nr:MAG TPA_asm: type I neck protein [Caudoviricetes sp.]
MRLNAMLETRTPEVLEQIRRGVHNNLTAAAVIWHAGVIRKLQGNRTGRLYFVPGTGGVTYQTVTVQTKSPRYKVSSYQRRQKVRNGKTYRASRPGEAPASRLGDLRTSYQFRVKQDEAEVGTPLDYAVFLENGTARMAPRPHLKPGYFDNADRIKKALGANVI